MKGGVTCLKLFRRKMKQSDSPGDEMLDRLHGHEDLPLTVENLDELAMNIVSSGNGTPDVNYDSLGHEVVQECSSTLVEHEASEVGDLSVRPVANFAYETQMGEIAYEGEDEDANDRRPEETDSDRPSSDVASEFHVNLQEPSHTGILTNDSAVYYETGLKEAYGANTQCPSSFADLEGACGHVSDPGVYHSKEIESTCSSPLVEHGSQYDEKQKNEIKLQKQASLGDPSDFESVRIPCSLSPTSGHHTTLPYYESSSGEVRELPSGAFVANEGSAKSEVGYEKKPNHAMFELHGSSEAMEPQKRKPWWKVFMVSHRQTSSEFARVIPSSLSEGAGPGMSFDIVSDVKVSLEKELEKGQDLEGKGKSSVNIFLSEQEADGKSGSVLDSLVLRGEGYGVNMKSLITVPKLGPLNTDRRLSRVQEWVKSVDPVPPSQDDDQGLNQVDECPGSPSAPAASFFGDFVEEKKKISGSVTRDTSGDADVEMAKMVVRSVNHLSTVAHFSGLGLKVTPNVGSFGGLKTLNLSANCIVRIIPGCLPKSLHSLDISRNQLVTIEGLKELSRLRVLNLSYNKLTRIGNGLASCTSVKELHLVGNKISEVEGLHRLSKLVFLDLSFNKLTTSKSVGQLAANYKSLQALNLLGNAVHSTLGDEQLRRFVLGICPQLFYLNKQPLKSVVSRDAAVDNVARAVLGKDAKGGGKNASKPMKRASAHQSGTTHRWSNSGSAAVAKTKQVGKDVVPPLHPATGDSHHRKAHHHRSRSYDKIITSQELPKGFVLLPSIALETDVVSKQGPINGMPRVSSDGVLFRENNTWFSPAGHAPPEGILQAH